MTPPPPPPTPKEKFETDTLPLLQDSVRNIAPGAMTSLHWIVDDSGGGDLYLIVRFGSLAALKGFYIPIHPDQAWIDQTTSVIIDTLESIGWTSS